MDEWEACDPPRPLLARGSTGQLVEHPLVKMIREHDILVGKLAEPLRKAHDGPEPVAVIRRTIGKSKPSKLRSVG